MKSYPPMIQPFLAYTKSIVNYSELLVSKENFEALFYIFQSNLSDSMTFEIELIPNGCIDVIIAYNTSDTSYEYVIVKCSNEIHKIILPVYEHYFGIRFHPGYNYDYISNFNYSLFIYQLRNTDTIDDKFLFYLENIDIYELTNINTSAKHMLNRIEETNGSILVSDLANELCYSERHTNRLFLVALGFGPKDYCKYIRFQNALHEIIEKPNRNNSEFIQNIGYSDQAHFQREFKNFTSMTPKQYIKRFILL